MKTNITLILALLLLPASPALTSSSHEGAEESDGSSSQRKAKGKGKGKGKEKAKKKKKAQSKSKCKTKGRHLTPIGRHHPQPFTADELANEMVWAVATIQEFVTDLQNRA